jgi:DNA-binding GntR family transcriptional regulator
MRVAEASAEQAQRLQIDPGAPVSIVSRMKARDDTPICEMSSVIPTSVMPYEAIELEFVDSITDMMARRHSPVLRFARAEVSAIACDPGRAKRLEVDAGSPLIVMEERVFGSTNAVLAWNVLHFVPKRIRLEVIRRVGPPFYG